MRPEFNDIAWVSDKTLDLVVVKITLVNKKNQDLGLDDLDEIEEDYYIDLSKLVGVKPYYPLDKDDGASDTESQVDIGGIEAITINVNIFHLLKVWEYYKIHKDDYKNV